MFAAITSLLISKAQTGLTLKDRKFSLLTTGILLALVSVPVSIISQYEVITVIFVVIATFAMFFLIGLRVVPEFPAIVLLSVVVVEMAFSHTVASGIEFAGLFLFTTALVYTIHFIILPTRPKVRLKGQIEMITTSIERYYEDITTQYPNLESGISQTQKSAEKVRLSISEFKRLWQLLGSNAPDLNLDQSRYQEIVRGLEDLFEYMLLIWQFRARAWESEKFKTYILQHPEFKTIIHQLLRNYDPELLKSSDSFKMRIQDQLQTINKEFLTVYHNEKDTSERKEWVAIFNAIHSLLALTNNINSHFAQTAEFAPEVTLKVRYNHFLTGLNNSIGKLKFSNSAFRFGLRSAIIVGVTIAYSKSFVPAHGFWLVLFSILLIRPNLGISIKAGRDRLIGTLAGCVIGFIFVSFVPAGSILFYFMALLSVFFMIWFANLNKLILMIMALTFLIISLFSLMYPSDDGVAWLRLAYTLAVVLFVIFISFLLWPEKARKKFADALAETIESEKNYFLSIIDSLLKTNTSTDTEKFRKLLEVQINRLDEVIDATKNEILQNRVIHHGINVNGFILRLRNTLHSMDFAAARCKSDSGFHELENELRAFSEHCEMAFKNLTVAFHERKVADEFPNLRNDFLVLRDAFREIRGKSDPDKDEITQLWNISTFIWNLKPLILELEGIKAEIDLKMSET